MEKQDKIIYAILGLGIAYYFLIYKPKNTRKKSVSGIFDINKGLTQSDIDKYKESCIDDFYDNIPIGIKIDSNKFDEAISNCIAKKAKK
jgi:hypothetical protein